MTNKILVLLVTISLCHQSAIDAFSLNRDHRRCAAIADCRAITHGGVVHQPTYSRFSAPLSTSTKLFAGEDSEKENAVLASYDIKDVDSKDVDVKFESLSDYITNKWIKLFLSGSISLTTPVRVSKSEDAIDQNGCKLVFQKVNTGYESKEEESDDKSTSSEEEESKQGGIEILVQKISADASQSLRVIARRCETDEDTIIKEMSEETVVKELQKAINVWKKGKA